MAIYHFRITPVHRAGGTLGVSAHHTGQKLNRGALGRSAYLSGQKLRSELDGKVVDYTSKEEGIDFERLFLPGGGTVDRESFWNSVDAHKVRVDAKNPVVARDIIVALPHELTADERRDAASRMCQWISDEFRVAVDLGIHKHTEAELTAGSDERNHHMHILVSERTVSPTGELGNLNRSLNAIEARCQGKDSAAVALRQKWEEIANGALAAGGHSERISCKSYAEQGVDKVARPRLSKEDYERQHRAPGLDKELARAEIEAEIQYQADRQRRYREKIEDIMESRRRDGEVAPAVAGAIGDVEAWVRDTGGQFIKMMARMDRADEVQRQIMRAKKIHSLVLREATPKEMTAMRMAKRTAIRASRLQSGLEKALVQLNDAPATRRFVVDRPMTKTKLQELKRSLRPAKVWSVDLPGDMRQNPPHDKLVEVESVEREGAGASSQSCS